MLIENVNILTSDGMFKKGRIEFDYTIREVLVYDSIDADADQYLIPGLIDVHTHGAVDGDHTDGSMEKMHKIAGFYAKNGVTSFLATTTTAPEETLVSAMETISRYERKQGGARCLGINMEGPFFSHEKRGAHPESLLKLPDISLYRRLQQISGNKIKLISIAPELPGAMEFIREVSKTCKISLAHSAADYETAVEGFTNGATHVTHLFNAMNPFLHRDPGIVGAALDFKANVEVISDGIHLAPTVIRAIFSLFDGHVCMISDSLSCTDMPDGDYYSAGLPVKLTNGKATLHDGTLAGSTISLMEGVRRAVSFGIPLARAVTAASKNCARAIGTSDRYGTLEPGMPADIVLLDSDLQVKKVFIAGEEVPIF